MKIAALKTAPKYLLDKLPLCCKFKENDYHLLAGTKYRATFYTFKQMMQHFERDSWMYPDATTITKARNGIVYYFNIR